MAVQTVPNQVNKADIKTRGIHISRFLAAFGLVFLIDLWLGLAHPLSHASVVNLDRSEVFFAFPNYVREAKAASKPAVVFLGSSVLLQPLMEQEATFLKQPIKPFEHRKLASLTSYLRTSDCYCLAMGGEMASDAYLLLAKSLDSGVRPDTVVFAAAPRDFQCNSVPSVVSTPMYQLLASIVDVPQIAQSTNLDSKELCDFALSRISMLYKYRQDITKYLWLRTKKVIDKMSPVALFEKNDGMGHTRIQKIGMFPDDAPGTVTLQPGSAMGFKSPQETIKEYKHHYDPIDQKRYALQAFYFSKLAELCSEKKIRLVVVNMPLSLTNRDLIPGSFYPQYVSQLQEVCSSNKAQFVNLQTPSWDNDSNYTDTVHMKPEKVPQFLNELFSAIFAQN